MSRLFLLFVICLTQVSAYTLNEIITIALKQNNSLESIQHRISANNSAVDASNQFANPALAYNVNTLDNKEKMAKQTLSVNQKVYFYGKRDSKKDVAIARGEVLNQNLLQAKVNLVNGIRNQAYKIWELEELYKIILDYEDLTKHNIELSQSYTSTSANQHMGIMSAKLTLSNLRIQKSSLSAQIKSAYLKLSYLTSFRVDKLDLNISIDDLPDIESLKVNLVNNKALSIREKEIDQSKAKVNLLDLDNYPDINLLASYSFRKNFDNYAILGFGMSLPIYGSENYRSEGARAMVLSAKSLKEDTKIVIDSEFESVYEQMKSQYEIYHIIHDEAISQLDHMFELIDSSISTGGDLFKYIDILTQKLKLEQQSIKAIAQYNIAMAKILALSGEMK